MLEENVDLNIHLPLKGKQKLLAVKGAQLNVPLQKGFELEERLCLAAAEMEG